MLFLSTLCIVFTGGKGIAATVKILSIIGNILILLLFGHGFSDIVVITGCLIHIHSFALISVLFLARNKANRSDKKKDNSFHVVDFNPNVIKN